MLLRQSATPCYIWMSDLVEAAGGEHTDIELCGDEATLTQQGLALLTAVWDGEYDLLEEDSLESEDSFESEASSGGEDSSEGDDSSSSHAPPETP